MRVAAVLVALLAGACSSCATVGVQTTDPTAEPDNLIILPSLLNRLDVLAQGLHHEVIVCLTGIHGTRTALANGFHMPVHVKSSSVRVVIAGCPDNTLALWHNHPAPTPAKWLCRLSPVDLQSMQRSGWLFAVVHVRAGVWCWWSKKQIAAADTADGLAALPGQRSWSPES